MTVHGGDVWQGSAPEQWLDFSANLRPGGPPDWVKAALLEGLRHSPYYPDLRMTAARGGIARYLQLPESCVLPTAGGIEAIDLASAIPARRALLLTPTFGEYARAAYRRGMEVSHASLLRGETLDQVGLSNADIRPVFPADAVASVLREGDAVWICNPSNPLGCAFPRCAMLALLACVEAAHARLIVDEAFIGFCQEHSIADCIERHPALTVVGSLTKTLGIPGVRLGYLCAHEKILPELAALQLPWALNAFAAAVARALPEHTAQLHADAAQNEARRIALAQGLTQLGAEVYPSGANFLLAKFASDVSPLMRALHASHILVRECMSFPGIDDGRHLRLAVKSDAENARLLCALGEAL